MSLLQHLNLNLRKRICNMLDPETTLNFVDFIDDPEYQLFVKHMSTLCLRRTITDDLMVTFPENEQNQGYYLKLYRECPMLRQLTQIDNIIVAGGFINIAMDRSLKYDQYPTSDIDIFVNKINTTETIRSLMEFFDNFHAEYKCRRNIVNVYIPGYTRHFQIVCTSNENVNDILAGFHTCHVKCGLRKGLLIMTPDCQFAIRNKMTTLFKDQTKINIIRSNDRRSTSFRHICKIMNRGYELIGSQQELSTIDTSQVQVSHFERQIFSSCAVTSQYILELFKNQDVLSVNWQEYDDDRDRDRDRHYSMIDTYVEAIHELYTKDLREILTDVVVCNINKLNTFIHVEQIIEDKVLFRNYVLFNTKTIICGVPFYEHYYTRSSSFCLPPIMGTLRNEILTYDTSSEQIVINVRQTMRDFANSIFKTNFTCSCDQCDNEHCVHTWYHDYIHYPSRQINLKHVVETRLHDREDLIVQGKFFLEVKLYSCGPHDWETIRKEVETEHWTSHKKYICGYQTNKIRGRFHQICGCDDYLSQMKHFGIYWNYHLKCIV